MEYVKIALRIIFFYFFIILIYRLMGKREVGQLGIVDLIVSISIADIVTEAVTDTNRSIMISVVPIICLVALEMILSYSSLKNERIRVLLEGKPTFIIKNGKVNYQGMIKQKYNLDDLLTQLREKGERNIEDIEYAILENNGTLSVFPYSNKKQHSPLPMPVILDGKLQSNNIKLIGKKENVIRNMLKKANLKIDDIFYAFYRENSLFVIKYDEINKK